MDNTSLLSELLSQIWFRFALVALFGFLTGLEFREYILLRSKERPEIPVISLGTSRTFTFIALLGYLLFILDPGYRLYLAGMLGLLLFFGLFYHHKLKNGQTGLLQPLIALIVYTYGAIISLQPPWFLILVFVALVFTLSTWKKTHHFVEHIDPREMPILAKFLLLSGVILPLLPDTPLSSYIPVTPFKIWLAVVVVSSISYIGYILKKYLLKRQGYLMHGCNGGTGTQESGSGPARCLAECRHHVCHGHDVSQAAGPGGDHESAAPAASYPAPVDVWFVIHRYCGIHR